MSAPRAYLGLGTVAAATVFVEIVLTRIFSLTLFYHFAFVAISLAMLGMAGGAMYVYLHRDRYPAQASLEAMARLTTYFAGALVAAYVLALGVGFNPVAHPVAMVSLALIVGLWAVPFFLSGMVVSIALTRTPFPVGRLYAADLVGAGLGCLLVHPALSAVGPPASIGLTAITLLCAAQLMARPDTTASQGTFRRDVLGAAGLAGFVAICVVCPDWVSPKLIKGQWEPTPEKVFWNSYSRIAVFPFTTATPSPGWGMGTEFQPEDFPSPIVRKENIDANAETWITSFDGDLGKHGYLAYDVVNAAHHLRSDGPVAVVGVGGGRDVLSALVLGDHNVTGIELNPILIELLQEEYAEFAGNIANHPNVRLVSGEARNWLERTTERYDIIQISLIDTWAATASGAYSLSENTLYTTEAWQTLLSRLRPQGILTVSRWSGEAYRLAALSESALSAIGQMGAHRCVAILSTQPTSPEGMGVTTILLSPSPLSDADCERLQEAADTHGWQIVYSPATGQQPFLDLLTPGTSRQWQRQYFLDISAPTDDRPYFFHMLRPSSLLLIGSYHTMAARSATLQMVSWNLVATLILGVLGLMLVLAALGLTILPLCWRQGRGVWRPGDGRIALYFVAIGLGFMMIEIAIIQRTGIMLGHPVYGLQVTLFSLLLGSGLGSLISSRFSGQEAAKARLVLAAVALATATTILAMGPLGTVLRTAGQPVRIAAVALIVLSAGLFMGMPFPTGLGLARSRGREPLLPWLWGVNGVFSVIGAFLATTTGLFIGARATGLLGVACYVLACIAIWRYTRHALGDTTSNQR